MTDIYEDFIYKRTYSRWIESKKRRENWEETVDRYKDFFISIIPDSNKDEFLKAIDFVKNKNNMPSMRSLYTAGKALERDNIAGYNCCAIEINTLKSFPELLYILMNGTGVGFSVERQVICNLPEIPKSFENVDTNIVFSDSKRGWAEGYYSYIRYLFNGEIPKYDLSKIRPGGSILKTFGGRSSGPVPLDNLLKKTKNTIVNACGRKLNSLECHDICCFIAEAVVVGGVRRSSGISFSNLSDERMRNAKSGEFWITNPQRCLANNSVAYTEKPDIPTFMSEWRSLIKSGTGERGIVNRECLDKTVKNTGRRSTGYNWILNPCAEIILRPNEFCNLTEVVCRENDTEVELLEKVKNATILGCVQATLTDFKFINIEFKKNCEEERLLGVSLTGLRDCKILNIVSEDTSKLLERLRDYSKEIAGKWSKILNINMPAAITCVKPSGTVSQLVNSSSGLHPRFSKFYIRRVRVTSTDPLCKFLKEAGVNNNPEVGDNELNPNTVVFDFPIKSPEGCICNSDVSAIDQLEYWKMLKVHWCEHNPSCTVFVDEDEWLDVGAWVYKNWDIIGGLSFLNKSNNIYQLQPYEEISEELYIELLDKFPKIDFNELDSFEDTDNTFGAKEYACSAGSCELI